MAFNDYQNTTRRFAAPDVLDDFEISLALLLPNTTTDHAVRGWGPITYTH